jgi:hypothetical protein
VQRRAKASIGRMSGAKIITAPQCAHHAGQPSAKAWQILDVSRTHGRVIVLLRHMEGDALLASTLAAYLESRAA